LTTKFTRHTQDRFQLSAISLQSKTFPNTPLKLYGPLNVAHRALNAYYSFTRTSNFSQALIKIYVALYLPNLFSCQISSSGEASLVVSRWPLAKNQNPSTFILPACAGMGLASSGVCKPRNSSNPMFGASTTFIEPIRIGCRIDAQHYVGSC